MSVSGSGSLGPHVCLCGPRLVLMSSGSLKIQSPTKMDEGLYTCTARNRLGSASLSSWLQITGRLAETC